MEKPTPIPENVLDVISLGQLIALQKAGFAIVHQAPTESMVKAMLSARDLDSLPVAIDIEKAFHRAIAESIRIQNLTRTNPNLMA